MINQLKWLARAVRQLPWRSQTELAPARGDEVATWLRAQRDQYPVTSAQWDAVNAVLDDYRLRADYGLSLQDSTDGCP